MGKIITIGVSLLLGAPAFAQDLPNAPAQTTATSPVEEKPASPFSGVLTPDRVLPDGFTFYGLQFDLQELLESDSLKVTFTDEIRVRTSAGDILRSEKAVLDFSEESDSSAIFSDNVRLRSKKGIEIFADEATINEAEQTIVFSGNVSTYQGAAHHRGHSVIYSYETRSIRTSNLRTSFAPILMEAGSFRAIEGPNGTYYKGSNTGITTHDAARPNFWLRGEEVTVFPGEKVRFNKLKLYAGDTPILWLPSLTQSFDGEFNYQPNLGSRSNWGAYLQNAYTYDVGGKPDPHTGLRDNPTAEATWHVDFYSKRGLGLGYDLKSNYWEDNPNLTGLSLYYIYDLDPSERRSSEPRLGFDDPNRFRAQLRHRIEADWLPGATGHFDADLTLLSDRFLLEDFYTRDFTTDFNPDNILALSQQWDDAHLLTAWTRLRVNDHFQSDQRLPEIAFDQIRRPIFGTSILHESQNIIGVYREDLADFVEDDLREEAGLPTTLASRQDEISELLEDTGFARFHTYHELSLPISLKSGLRLAPRVGAGHTSYLDIQGPLDTLSRTHLSASIDASLKFTKVYPEWVSPKWGLDSALHVLQPYATASVLQTDNLDPDFNPIDRLTASTRPRTLNPGRLAAIDALNDWQILRLGARNTILTKRDDSTHQWLSIDTYVDIFGNDPEFDRNVSNLYSDLHWSPLPWLNLTLETQLPLFSNSNFTEFSTGLQFMPNEDTQLEVRHRYLESHPILFDSNLLEISTYHRINEEWGISSTHRWEFEDNQLEFQQYSLHRNLDSWAFTIGFFGREDIDTTEYGVTLGFTLTDFPSLSLDLNN